MQYWQGRRPPTHAHLRQIERSVGRAMGIWCLTHNSNTWWRQVTTGAMGRTWCYGPHIAGPFFVADSLALRRETYTTCVTAIFSELMDLLPAVCSVQFELARLLGRCRMCICNLQFPASAPGKPSIRGWCAQLAITASWAEEGDDPCTGVSLGMPSRNQRRKRIICAVQE
jgi:hypothetical protein